MRQRSPASETVQVPATVVAAGAARSWRGRAETTGGGEAGWPPRGGSGCMICGWAPGWLGASAWSMAGAPTSERPDTVGGAISWLSIVPGPPGWPPGMMSSEGAGRICGWTGASERPKRSEPDGADAVEKPPKRDEEVQPARATAQSSRAAGRRAMEAVIRLGSREAADTRTMGPRGGISMAGRILPTMFGFWLTDR